MKITYETRGDFKKTERWLDRLNKTDMSSPLNQIAAAGTKSLSTNTPADTGETANSWKGTVTKRGQSSEIIWTNDAHPGANVNIAKIIDLGHGTGTGGYVPPRPYIKNAMKPIWDRLDEILEKELSK